MIFWFTRANEKEMNNIVNLIILDYYILRASSLGILVSAVGIATLAGIIALNPPLIMGIVLMIFGFSMGSLFAVAEKNNLNTLYGILPVKKQQIVTGRYIFTLIVGILNIALGTILTFAVSFIVNIKLSSLTFIAWLCGSFFLFCLLISIQFPIYFRYDFSKVSAVANMPIIILFLIGSALITKYPGLFNRTIDFFITNQYMIWLAGVVGALLLFCASLFVSSMLYKKRDL